MIDNDSTLVLATVVDTAGVVAGGASELPIDAVLTTAGGGDAEVDSVVEGDSGGTAVPELGIEILVLIMTVLSDGGAVLATGGANVEPPVEEGTAGMTVDGTEVEVEVEYKEYVPHPLTVTVTVIVASTQRQQVGEIFADELTSSLDMVDSSENVSCNRAN